MMQPVISLQTNWQLVIIEDYIAGKQRTEKHGPCQGG